MQKVLSVSVAAYNVAAFIAQCLDSFLAPGVMERVEVLVTDDGSTDNTPQLVAEYEKRCPDTVRLISQKNAGPGSTVNSGIAHATGKYFRMVDGDDWVNTEDMGAFLDFLEKTDADMVCADFCRVDHETGEQELSKLGAVPCVSRPFEEACGNLSLSMHNVTYKTALLQDNGIHLDNCFYTDSEYLLFPIPYVKTVGITDQTVYMYRVSLSTQSMNIGSLQRNRDMHRLVLGHLCDAYQAYEKSGAVQPNTGEFLRRSIASMAGMQLCIYLSMEDEKTYRKETENMLREIQSKSRTLYDQVNRATTFHLLTSSHFVLFSMLAKRQKKKLGLI